MPDKKRFLKGSSGLKVFTEYFWKYRCRNWELYELPQSWVVHHSGPQLYLDTLWHRDPWRLIRCLPLHSIVQHFVFVHNVISCFSHVQKVQHHVVMQFCLSVHIVQSYGSKCHFITALLLSLIKMSGLPLATELMTTPKMYLDLHMVLRSYIREFA